MSGPEIVHVYETQAGRFQEVDPKKNVESTLPCPFSHEGELASLLAGYAADHHADLTDEPDDGGYYRLLVDSGVRVRIHPWAEARR